MCRTELCRFGIGNWIFLLACLHLFTQTQGGEKEEAVVRLTAEPADCVVAAGERAVLSCAAASPARVSWRYSAQHAPTRDHSLPHTDTYRKQAANGSLVLESMSAALAGQYQCVAALEGVGVVVSRVATVHLAEVPELAEVGGVVATVEGGVALLSCGLRPPPRLALRVLPPPGAPAAADRRVYGAARLHAHPPLLKLNVTWLKNGVPVRMEAARVSLTPSGALEIDPVKPHDAARYRCRVSLQSPRDALARTGSEIELRVNTEIANLEAAPRFIATPQPVTVMEGASVTLECAAVGNPKPQVTWLSNGVAIDLNDLDSRLYLVGAGSLRVQSARVPDAGVYTCRATNRLDSADHSTHLYVLSMPRVMLSEGGVVRARRRGDSRLGCEVKGRPPPRVTWLKDGEPLSPHNHDIALVDGSSLRIQGVLPVDAGMFQCFATSSAGSATAALRLVVLPAHHVPDPPTGLEDLQSVEEDPELELGETSSAYTPRPSDYDDSNAINDISFHADEGSDSDVEGNSTAVSAPHNLRPVIVKHRFVTLSWEEPEHKSEDITGYAVFYKVKGSERERVSRGGPSRHEANVGSLQPNTTYVITARAYTSGAASPPTPAVEVTTPAEEVSFGPPEDVRAEAAGPHSARVSWAPPPAPTRPAKYAVYFTEVESGREQSVWCAASPCPLEGLRAATQYRVRVSAVGGAASAERTLRTWAAPPAAPPANVTALPATHTSIQVRWEAPPARTHGGPLTGYKIRFRLAGGGGAAGGGAAGGRRRADSLTTPADARRADLADLEPGATYQIRMCAINANGSGPFSDWVSAATAGAERADTAVPDLPPSLTARAGRDWISVWWGGAGGGGAKGWWLGWGLGVPDERSRELPIHRTSYVIRGLEANSEYVISLRASNALGLGPAVYATVRTRSARPDDDSDGPDEPDEPDDPDDPDDPDEADDTPPLIPPVGLKVIMLSGTTAVVYWTDPTLPKGQPATDGRRYVVRWASAGGGRPRTYNVTDLNCMLDDLRPFTTYEFAVKLIKGGRESAWSMLASNTTLEAAPGGAPRDLRVAPAAPASRAADLVWASPARPNGRITGYVIMYAPQRGPESGAAEEWTAVAAAGERARARVDRLRPRTTYAFKIQARNGKGLGPFSPVVVYTTGPETGEGAGLASATSAWLWASAGGACAVLALAAALALSLCCRRPHPPLSPDTSTYQKASASAGIKPPDLWIHHDQMELKHIDKSLHSSAISAGSVDGGGGVGTLGRAPPVEYEPARHAPAPASLDRRYVPTYVESSSSCAGSADTCPLATSSPCARCDLPLPDYSLRDYSPHTYLAMTGVGVGVGVGCSSTCERRRHVPDQSTPLLAGVAPLGSTQSSLGSLHAHAVPPCASSGCPLGAAVGGDVYASAMTARERGHYVAYEPLGQYTHRDSLSGEAAPGGATSCAGSLRRGGCGGPLHSFTLADNASDRSTPSHSKAGSVRETSPYKKSASSSPGRLQPGGVGGELEGLTSSRSTERLHRDMQNLEGLMKDLSAITQQQFHC
ncbi:netrin receptor DCC isoform X2 [Pieris rapae]|uniref:netrin receptor DCC isoform X2 n=1 Tax=Pieris rapae TaxID=64459 RepID=UPI001E27C419|nr:netrin receptor DCC isoform X2 [Pieris rapae]